jgi:hypothetical protein
MLGQDSIQHGTLLTPSLKRLSELATKMMILWRIVFLMKRAHQVKMIKC